MSVSPVIVQATTRHTSTFIFLHGLGDTGHGWSSAMAAIRPPHMKVICPTAPTMPVTINRGFQMPSWFDLITIEVGGQEDEEGIRNASKTVHTMIENEISNGIPSERIVVGGFSQGGALALYSGLTFPKQLAGIVTLSGWMPMHKYFPAARVCPETVPVFQAHGDCDPVVQHKFGQISARFIKTFMTNAKFTSYSGLSHSSSDEELEDLRRYLEEWTGKQ